VITLASYVPGGAGATSGACRSGSCAAQRIVYPEASRGLVRQARLSGLNVAAGAADASRAMLSTSCRKVALLTAIFAFH